MSSLSGIAKSKLTQITLVILVCFTPIIDAGKLTDSATFKIIVRIPSRITADFEPFSSAANQNSYLLCVNNSGAGTYRIHRPFDNETSNLAVGYGQISASYSNELAAGKYSDPIKSQARLSGKCDHTETVQINISPPASKPINRAIGLIVTAE